MKLPLVDLSIQHHEIEAEVREGFERVIASGNFIRGESVSEFETAYADLCGVDFCVGVASGTDALELALRALGVGRGDEVIVPANTFIASALAVLRAGADPVLVDCNEDDHLIDLNSVEDRITSRTRAVLAVDLFGQLPPLESLEELCAARGLFLLEDAAQAQGAARHGRRAGSFGEISATSFYPGKNLGAYGDAGAITTRDEDLADRVRRLGNYGSEAKYEHPVLGFNSRLDSLQAVVLNAKLGRLLDWNRARRAAASRYEILLESLPDVIKPRIVAGNDHVWHIYAIRISQRNRVLAALQRAGVEASVHYPIPIHLQPSFAFLDRGEGSFPNAERAAAEMISLPIFPGITEIQQERVVEILAEALAEEVA